jgi:hypothetical protein
MAPKPASLDNKASLTFSSYAGLLPTAVGVFASGSTTDECRRPPARSVWRIGSSKYFAFITGGMVSFGGLQVPWLLPHHKMVFGLVTWRWSFKSKRKTGQYGPTIQREKTGQFPRSKQPKNTKDGQTLN